MKTDWAKSWNLTTAVIRLVLGSARYESVDNHESCLPNVINDGFEGRFGRLQQREDMKSLVAVLPQVVDSLRRRMVTVGLDKNTEFPPVVWLRLMHEAGLKPVDVAAREFEHWQEQLRANGMTILYRRFDEVKRKFVGPTRERDGLGEVPGYSVNEMLTEQRKSPRSWPYCYRWMCVCKASKGTGGLIVAKIEAPISDANTPVPLATLKRRASTVPPKQRRMRSRQALERTCGARLITALEGCLTKEVELKKSVLEVGGRNRRAYDCHLSLDELVTVLKKKYNEQLTCTDSTLKSALPHFVSCPRGRPGGIAGVQ